ncbi:hypothetical protein CIK64_14680 [Brevibacterium aurantiacum]|uniref:Uncharacterized protein n=1 Tax=Brevibacterium aurantiacum TaxID=273384 RepID=A0A2A3Z2P4_BREAU|nr:hypothetical protein CIK64_14680 [Brevibacterium aurantiacum]
MAVQSSTSTAVPSGPVIVHTDPLSALPPSSVLFQVTVPVFAVFVIVHVTVSPALMVTLSAVTVFFGPQSQAEAS